MEWKPKRFTREQMEERRLAAVELLRRRKLSKAEIGRRLGVSREAVRKWAKILDQKGKRGLRCRCIVGRPCRLTELQQNQLKELLKAGAQAAGFSTERWTLRRVRQLIEDTFHVHYHFRSLGTLLRQLGFSTQLPQAKAHEGDEEAIRAWLSKDWSRIKKALRTGKPILFLDEFGYGFREHFARTWAIRGQSPILKRRESERRVISTIAALSTRGKLYRSYVEGSVHSSEIVRMLKWLLRALPEGFILVWDRSSIHRAKDVKDFLASHPQIVVEQLPAYAPEINPEEFAHGNIKEHLRNFLPMNKAEIKDQLRREFSRLRRRPDILLGCFHSAGLRIKHFF